MFLRKLALIPLSNITAARMVKTVTLEKWADDKAGGGQECVATGTSKLDIWETIHCWRSVCFVCRTGDNNDIFVVRHLPQNKVFWDLCGQDVH